MAQHKRLIAELTSPEAAAAVGSGAILCLPMGSLEQHGPHLPLHTDTVLAEAFTAALVARWGETYDLWQLPALPIGLSREHAWASGTVSLSVATMTALLRELAGAIARTFPARNLVVINGHGGNRGLLESLVREIAGDFGLNICAMHLGAMISPPGGGNSIEIHGGKDETSAMLALAPELVRQERMADSRPPADRAAVRTLILDPATSWPWRSDDPRIADRGVIGDAPAASVEHGRAIVARAVEAAGAVLAQFAQPRK
jgi:creatinine amidohydrolase